MPRSVLPQSAVATRVASAASIAVLLILLVVLGVRSKDAALREAEVNVRESARAVVGDVLRVLDIGDLLLHHQLDIAATVNPDDPWDVAQANLRLQRMVEIAPYVFRLFLIDHDGNAYASSMRDAPRLNAREREYFQYHLSGEHGLHMSSVMRSQATGEPIVILSRRMSAADGSFRGVVLVSFQLDTLRDFANLLLPEGRPADFQVIGPNMQIVVDGTPPPDRAGDFISPDHAALFRASDSAVWTYTAPKDVERVWAHERVGKYPVYVRVGVETSQILAHWREATAPYAAFSLLVLAVLIGLAVLGNRHARAVELARRELDLANRELEHRVRERTVELAASNDALRASETRLQLILDSARLGTYERDLKTGLGHMSAFGRALHGLPTDEDRYTIDSWMHAVHHDDRKAVQAALYRALAGQAPYDVEYRVVLPDGQIRWIGARGKVIFGPTGEPRRAAGISYEITDRKVAEQRLRLLAREVDHRAKNLLSVIQSVVRMTRARSVEEFIDAVEGRITALGRAHTLLADSRWAGADLRRLVDEELAPHRSRDERRIQISGPDVMLTPPAAQSASMALHELATNAAKYGALSQPQGRVSLEWTWSNDGRLNLIWTESGGPPVREPTHFGFGTRVITGTIQKQLGGEVEFVWRPEGLRCRFTLPAAAICDLAPQEMK